MEYWRVKEQYHGARIATKDSDYDKITEFNNRGKALRYYLDAYNKNYKTVLEVQINGKWEFRICVRYSI